MARVAVLGGGIAGWASALALAGAGVEVVVVERDPGYDGDGDAAYAGWKRPGVPQFRQPHMFSARVRNLLLARAPAVVARVLADGAEELNLFTALASAQLWRAEDEELASLLVRRPGFELALRREVEARSDVTVLCPAVAQGLLFARPHDGVPRVAGLRLRDGRTVPADVVFDCGGRASPVPGWLRSEGVQVRTEAQDCDSVYYTRYYRRSPGASAPWPLVTMARAELDGIAIGGFLGDHQTFGFLLAALRDPQLRELRHTPVWEAVARSIPAVTPWLDRGTPLTEVQTMGSQQNMRRHYTAGDEPVVLGLLAVGDALCTTNPFNGWGAAMALTYAYAAVDAVVQQAADLRALALQYEAAIGGEADAVFAEAAAMDRERIYRWRRAPVPAQHRPLVEHQQLMRCLARGAFHDPVLGRAYLRWRGLLDPPGSALSDPQVREHAENTRRILAAKPPRYEGPDRAGLLALLARGGSGPAEAGKDG